MRRLPRPTPGATPIQRACWHLAEAVRAGRVDRRTHDNFVGILVACAAAEAARRLDAEQRPSR